MANSFGSFYADASGGEGDRCKYPTRLDTYGCGCYHNCSYCYARSLLDFRGMWDPDNPRIASTQDISKALRKVKSGTVLRLGGMTDCFQPIERIYGATRQAIQMLNARGIGYLIVTKSDLVAEKAYTRVMDPELAHIQISVTSTSDAPNFLKERASAPSDRLRAAERLSKAGFDVSLRVFTVHTRIGRYKGSESFWRPQVPRRVPQGQHVHLEMAGAGGLCDQPVHVQERRVQAPPVVEEGEPARNVQRIRIERMRGRARALRLLARARQREQG